MEDSDSAREMPLVISYNCVLLFLAFNLRDYSFALTIAESLLFYYWLLLCVLLTICGFDSLNDSDLLRTLGLS